MASSRKIGTVYAELAIQDKMAIGLKRARKQLNDFGGFAIKAGAVAAAATAAGLAAGTKRALDLGGRLSDVSAQTGIAVSDVMKLERAFTEGGLGADVMGSNVARMQKAIADTA
jgi:hypothetical protein